MRRVRSVLAVVLCLCMLIPYLDFPHAHAASGSTNMTLTVDKTTANVGETVTVVIKNAKTTAAGVGVYLEFDKTLLECTSITGFLGNKNLGMNYYDPEWDEATRVKANVGDTVENTNSDGIFSFGVVIGSDVEFMEGIIATLTFNVKAAGTVTFTLNEQTSGTDGFKGVAATQTLTIKGGCDHTNVTFCYEPATATTHNVICECGETVKTVNCTGEDDGDHTTDVTCVCGNTVTAGTDHKDDSPKDHVCDYVGCKVPMGTHASNAEHPCLDGKCEYCGETVKATAEHSQFKYEYLSNNTHAVKCGVCSTQTGTENCSDGNDADELCDKCNNNLHVCVAATYKDLNDGTHQAMCACGQPVGQPVSHTYDKDHKCVCTKVEEFDLYLIDADGTGHQFSVPYGENLAKYLNDTNLVVPEQKTVDEDLRKGVETFKGWCTMDGQTWFTEDSVMPAQFLIVGTCYEFTGWSRDNSASNPWVYEIKDVTQKTGWTEIGDFWYYLDTETGARAEGLTRVPYPTESINGITYGPNADDKAYWEAHKDDAEDPSKYSDAETAVFVFDKNGVFQNDFTGILDGKYAQNGMAAWHPGFVQVDGEWYYFVGDKDNGGNKPAEGLIYVTRNAEAAGYKTGDQLYFVNGKVDTAKNGIVEIEDVLYYFESGKLAKGKGLVDLGEGKYIFVRSAGQLAVGEYYVPANKIVASGLYTFDKETGYMVQVPMGADVNGIVDGYYYVNGKVQCGAGLIEIDGAVYYIRSNGQVATGMYYITNANGIDGYERGDKLFFDENGKLQPAKNGIYEKEGAYYYYEDNYVKYGAGVVDLTDNEGKTFYIYVRSNGQLATGKYWPTELNGLLKRGEYDWGTDGKYYPEG